MRKNAKCRNKNCKKITLTKNSLRDFSSGKPSAEQIFLTVCSVHQKASQSSPPAGGESIEIIFSGGVYVGKIPLSPPVCGASAFGGRSVRAADCDLHVGKARRAFPKKITPPERSDFGKAITGPSWQSRRERRTQRHPQLRARKGSCGSSRCRTSSGRS